MGLLSKRLLTSAAIFGLCVPVSIVVGVITFPFWGWLESSFGIEAVGHSGTAAWCYWTIYVLAATDGLLVYCRLERCARETS